MDLDWMLEVIGTWTKLNYVALSVRIVHLQSRLWRERSHWIVDLDVRSFSPTKSSPTSGQEGHTKEETHFGKAAY